MLVLPKMLFAQFDVPYFFVGWASAEFLTTKLIPLWVGAKGIEFDWKYTQLSLDSNISLVCTPDTYIYIFDKQLLLTGVILFV